MDLRVKLNVAEPTLYELSFFSLDLLRLSVVSSLVDEAQSIGESKSTGESKLVSAKNIDRTYQNRSSLASYYKKHKKDIQVKEFKEGSIELVIAGVGVAASVIIPTIFYYLNKKNQEENQMVNFTVDSQDPEINRFLGEVQNRNFGSFDDCFDFVRQTMIRRGYSFEAISDNTYKALKANSNRLEDVVLTTRRINRN
ncbi:hypothetical protein EKO29_07355 [Colwellia sp. Arc7-635]|uniref:hypothetical protein n=1 Tax=Colwellia sp. Arc7-635 TaxID=2497879 RepID=UPI000F858006|nr:hypothetical protein [Colwellia sp. Arc7-635]AZQ83859.1 hypothetical protein EKO29_07355 [Colwellia sp. Arc7-635]